MKIKYINPEKFAKEISSIKDFDTTNDFVKTQFPGKYDIINKPIRHILNKKDIIDAIYNATEEIDIPEK